MGTGQQYFFFSLGVSCRCSQYRFACEQHSEWTNLVLASHQSPTMLRDLSLHFRCVKHDMQIVLLEPTMSSILVLCKPLSFFFILSHHTRSFELASFVVSSMTCRSFLLAPTMLSISRCHIGAVQACSILS